MSNPEKTTGFVNIYDDGIYLRQNPDLHLSDSFFKFTQILPFLQQITPAEGIFRILDVGGGAGVLGYLVALFFHYRGAKVEVTAVDLGGVMLALQKRNNPFIVETIQDGAVAAFTGGAHYDLTLTIDVLEHIEDYRAALHQIASGSDWLVCNMPIERNLLDYLRNIYMCGRYYREQRRSIGHLHFFSYRQHLADLRGCADVVAAKFSPYCEPILTIDSPDHKRQRENRLRRAELVVSRALHRVAPWLSPMIVQGSCFSLSKRRTT